MTAVLQVAKLAVAAMFLLGALFNAVYTLRHGEEFYGSFAANAWLPAARALIPRVILPHARPFTLLLIAFQLLVAGLIVAGGDLATVGLTLGAVFSLLASTVSSNGGALGNLVLASLMALLAYAS
jgi:hypothetical protein